MTATDRPRQSSAAGNTFVFRLHHGRVIEGSRGLQQRPFLDPACAFVCNAIEVVERTFTDAHAIINSGAVRVVAYGLAVDRGITDGVHAQYARSCDAPVCMESMPGSTLTVP